MFDNKDPRDISENNPDAYVAYTVPNTSSKITYYVLKETLENLKEGKLPEADDFSTGYGGCYYANTNGRYGGTACAAHFLKAKEIQDFLLNDPTFIKKAIESNVTWFMPEQTNVFMF